MDVQLSPARQARAKHRHDLHTLTYVTLDQANGGVVRNLTAQGIGVQAVGALRPLQQVRLRFELRYPRVRVEARGEVVWSTFSGQCGIRFLDLSPSMARHINAWIFGSLLETAALHAEREGSMFSALPRTEQEDGLLLSGAPLRVIELPAPAEPEPQNRGDRTAEGTRPMAEFDWLSQPLSGRSLIWTIDSLVCTAALLLFGLVFLSVTREAPPWPFAMLGLAILMVGGLYWGFFKAFGGLSPGARLARLLESTEEAEDEEDRFR